MMLTFRPIQNWPTLAEAAGLDRDTDPAVVRRMAKALYRDASTTYHPDAGGES